MYEVVIDAPGTREAILHDMGLWAMHGHRRRLLAVWRERHISPCAREKTTAWLHNIEG